MLEAEIERKLVADVKRVGGLAIKLTSAGYRGLPDRLVVIPGGKLAFVEVKAPGKKLSPIQRVRHNELRRLGFKVYVVDAKTQIGGLISEIRTT